MSFHSWLQSLRSALTPGRSQGRRRQRRSPRAATYRPNLEALEDRLTPSFGPATDFPVGLNPAAVATGDFNNDGQLDLATANAGDTTVSVLLGDGQGGFGAASNFATGASPSSVAVGDFDGDGNLDLVTANQSLRYVSVLRGNGDGTFQPPVTTDTSHQLTDPPVSMAPVADFNADGKTDLAFVIHYYSPWFDGFGDDIEVLLSDGQGGFAGHSSYGGGGTLSGLAVADLNADGKPDVVTATTYYDESTDTNTGAINIYLNGRFLYWIPTSPFPQAVAVGDFTRDDIPDLVIADWYGQTLDVLPGDGNGAFGSPISNPFSSLVGVADFNGDGKLDIDSGGSVLLGLGDGTFMEPYAAPTSPTVGDFNGDGLPDVASIDANAVAVRLNDGVWPSVPHLPPVVRIGNATVTEGNTGTTAANFTISLSEASTETVTVTYATTDSDATAGSDYVAGSGTLTFAPGETSKTITVQVIGDRLAEPNETFAVNLTGATNATIADDQGIGTILDDEPRISIQDATVNEGNTGTRPITFTVSLSVAYDVPVTISYATANSTATAGSDYQAVSGTLTIPAGQTSGTITVQVSGDRLAEPNETFVVNLSNPNYGVISDGQGVGTIVDDEPRISIGDVTKYEGKKNQTMLFTFTVTLSAAYDQPVTVSFKTTDGTATTSDKDYVAQSGTLTFAPGETTKTVTIVVNGDSKKEADETFYLDLFGLSSNALFTKNRGIGTILNDD